MLHIGSYFLFDTENFAILEQFSVIGLGSEIVFDGLRVELHIHLVFIPDQIADAPLPVIDLDRSPLGGLHLRYPDLIDFLLHIMAAKMVSCFLTLFYTALWPKSQGYRRPKRKGGGSDGANAVFPPQMGVISLLRNLSQLGQYLFHPSPEGILLLEYILQINISGCLRSFVFTWFQSCKCGGRNAGGLSIF